MIIHYYLSISFQNYMETYLKLADGVFLGYLLGPFTFMKTIMLHCALVLMFYCYTMFIVGNSYKDFPEFHPHGIGRLVWSLGKTYNRYLKLNIN